MGAKTVRRLLLAGLVGALLTGCIATEPPVVATPPPAPPVRVEVAPPAPGPAYVWVPGHWRWHRRGYVWVPGSWAVPAQSGFVWVPGHWAPRPGGYVWIEGHWRAP